MIQELLTSVKNMLGMSSTQNKEFKTEAVKNNKNVFSAIKDISKMFSSQARADVKQSQSLASIESNTSETSSKVDRVSVLMQQSISIQTQMLAEIKNLASILGKGEGEGGSKGTSFLGMAGAAALGLGTGLGLNELTNLMNGGSTENQSNYQNTSSTFSGPVNFSGETQKVLEAIKAVESGGDYTTPNKAGASSASGAYQFIDSTWQSLTQKYGIGTEYAKAMQAPSQVQDAVAGKYVEEILRDNNNDVSKVPLVWYTGNPQGKMSAEALASNRGQQAQAYQEKFLRAYQNIEGDETGTYPSGKAQPQNTPMGASGGKVIEKQRELAGVRKLPLSDNLKRVLQQAASAAGVDAVVYSGGQAAKGKGGPRTGSTRHDNGNAADLYLMKNGEKLSDTNLEHKAIMAKFVSAAVAAGATGVGAGHGYMGPSNIHVGFGKQATWGGADWIRQAASGIYNNQDLQAQGGGDSYSGGAGGSYGGVGKGTTDLSSAMNMAMGNLLGGFGMGSFMGGDILSLMSAFFGMPLGMSGNTNQQSNQNSTASYTENEENESTDSSQKLKETTPNATKTAKEQVAAVESDFRNYEGITKQIQTAAIEDFSRSPVVIEKKPETTPYTTSGIQEPSTSFGTMDNSYKETRASWAPRIAVLRPGDETKNLTWAARIAPNMMT